MADEHRADETGDDLDYSEEVRAELALCLADLEPGEWGELALCPGPFGCPYETHEEAIEAGVERDFCDGCRVIHCYRPSV